MIKAIPINLPYFVIRIQQFFRQISRSGWNKIWDFMKHLSDQNISTRYVYPKTPNQNKR